MSILQLERPKVFRDVKEAPILLLFLILFSDIAFNWLYVNVLKQAFSIPSIYTNGLISPLHVLSMLKIAFIVGGIIFWIARFRLYHLGMAWKNIKMGILTTFFLWSMLQITQIIYNYLTQGRIGFLNDSNQEHLLLVLGTFAIYIISKALFDEITYRGLLLPQFHLKLQRYLNLPDHVTLALALFVSQAFYIIIQLPILTSGDTTEISSALTFTSVFFLSILTALIYLRTKNLYIAIGLHTLWFNPAFLVTPSVPHTFVLVIFAIGFILLWPLLPNSPSLMTTWPLQIRQRT